METPAAAHDNTFSIIARCRDTGALAVASCTARLAVGNRVPFVAGGVGVAATQADTNPELGRVALERMRAGRDAAEALQHALSLDPGQDARQLIVMDYTGGCAAHTGRAILENSPWAGTLAGKDCLAAGNLLAGESVLPAMVEAFENAAGFICHRVLCALEAGQAAGGDKRGKLSAALLAAGNEPRPSLDLRIDMSDNPVPDLHRLYEAYVLAFPTAVLSAK